MAGKDFKVMIEPRKSQKGLIKQVQALHIRQMGFKPKNRNQGACGIGLEVLERGELRHRVGFKLNHSPVGVREFR